MGAQPASTALGVTHGLGFSDELTGFQFATGPVLATQEAGHGGGTRAGSRLKRGPPDLGLVA